MHIAFHPSAVVKLFLYVHILLSLDLAGNGEL